MDEVLLSDDMKKESKIELVMMILLLVLAIVVLIGGIYLWEYPIKKLILLVTTIVLFASLFLYGFLYARRYNLTVTKEEIRFKTLFRTVIIRLSDIKEYTYKRYSRMSAFYQFKLLYLDKKIVINTRYRDEFDQILQQR